jgi:hypothetical protein
MASVGPGHHVVVVLHVGGSKSSYIKLVLQREPRIGKTWFLAGSILPSEEHIDVVVRELLEDIGLTLNFFDFTLLSKRSSSSRLTWRSTRACLRLLGIYSGSLRDSSFKHPC